jgi:hypothetical protein
MRVERWLIAVSACVVTAVHAAQSQDSGRVLGRRKVLPTVSVKAWNAFGSIRFVGWDKDSIVMRGTVSKSRKRLFTGDSTAVKLGTEGSADDDDTSRSDLVVYLPRRAMIAAKSVAADIVASDVSGWFYTSSGNIRCSGNATSITAESVSGNLDLSVATPWIKAQTGSGHLLLRGAAQDADLSTVGGTLSIATSTLLRGQFSSVLGEIQYAASPAPGSIFEFSNHSGSVDLLLPQAASAALALSSITGPIENGFVNVRPAASAPHSMRINLGRGDAQVTVRTFKGVIRLRPQP